MPISYSIDAPQRLVVSTAWGVLRFAEVVGHQNQLLADLQFERGFNQIIGCTGVTQFELSGEEARTIASRRLFSRSSKRAFVATSAAMFGVGRMLESYQQFVDQAPQTSVFRSVDDALSWIRAAGE